MDLRVVLFIRLKHIFVIVIYTIKTLDQKNSNAKSKMTSRTMTTQVLEQIAKELNVTLTIKNERDVKGNNKTRLSVKNKGCDIVIPLGYD